MRLLLVLAALVLSPTLSPLRAGALEGMVVRVIDGDTIHVRIGRVVEKVRYIGIDAPEVDHPELGEEPGGRTSQEVNRQLVTGRWVRLVTDVQARDRHGRLLAYVWTGGTFVNAEMIRRGWAHALTVPPNVRYQALFLRLQREAREGGRGLWRPPRAAGLAGGGDVTATPMSSPLAHPPRRAPTPAPRA